MLLCCPKGVIEAGVDEAGRGPIAGPVVAAAVILPSEFFDPRIRDSKKMTLKAREELEPIIKSSASAWAIGEASEEEIDQLNILGATYLAMHRAIEALEIRPEMLRIDGNRFKNSTTIPFTTEIKGDDRFLSIAAASILAKNHRDRLMAALHATHPRYNWAKNQGYPTAEHLKAVATYGVTPHHRKSFKGVREWVNTLF